jgi:hypothetical protein
MLALAGEHHGFDAFRQHGENRLDPAHRRIVERIAFLRAPLSRRNYPLPVRASSGVPGSPRSQ